MKTFAQFLEEAVPSIEQKHKMYSSGWHREEAARHHADAEKYKSIGFHTLAQHKTELAHEHEAHANEAEASGK